MSASVGKEDPSCILPMMKLYGLAGSLGRYLGDESTGLSHGELFLIDLSGTSRISPLREAKISSM